MVIIGMLCARLILRIASTLLSRQSDKYAILIQPKYLKRCTVVIIVVN